MRFKYQYTTLSQLPQFSLLYLLEGTILSILILTYIYIQEEIVRIKSLENDLSKKKKNVTWKWMIMIIVDIIHLNYKDVS